MQEDPAVFSMIRSFGPDIVGISFCTETRHNARYWAGLIKERMPHVRIVVGGPHVSFVPEQTLNHWKVIDYAICFEGEKPLGDLISALISDAPLSQVPSLAYRDENGSVCVNARVGLIENLDTIPFPDMGIFCDGDEIILNSVPIEARYDLFQGPMVHVMTSRGCPFKCRFCSASHFWDGRVRFRSPGNVIEELKRIRKRWPTIKNLAFHDDAITLRRSHIEQISELMLKDRLDFKWVAWSRLDGVDRGLVRLMKKAGCVYLKFGVESGTVRGLELVGKHLRLDVIPEKVQMLKDEVIESSFSFIVGIPGETKEEAMSTIRMIRRLKLNRKSIQVVMGTQIYPGTYFCDSFEKEHGPIDWDAPDPSFEHLFGRDPLGNPLCPTMGFPAETSNQFMAARGLPFAHELRNPKPRTAMRDSSGATDQVHSVELWSPYILPQVYHLDGILKEHVGGNSSLLCVRGKSEESLLALFLADYDPGMQELALPTDVTARYPEAGRQLDEMLKRHQDAAFRLIVDLNSLCDVSAELRARTLRELRRILSKDGAAIFLFRNPRHLVSRLGRAVGVEGSLASQRRPLLETFTSQIGDAGFRISRQISGGVMVPRGVVRSLSRSVARRLSSVRLPQSIAVWNVMVCKAAGQ
jgi:tRNA A37 methylthiotransferase MiaB